MPASTRRFTDDEIRALVLRVWREWCVYPSYTTCLMQGLVCQVWRFFELTSPEWRRANGIPDRSWSAARLRAEAERRAELRRRNALPSF